MSPLYSCIRVIRVIRGQKPVFLKLHDGLHDDPGVDSLGKNLVVIGLTLAAVGALLWLIGRNGSGGLLPGDIALERKGVKHYFPIVTCLVASAVLSLIAWLMRR